MRCSEVRVTETDGQTDKERDRQDRRKRHKGRQAAAAAAVAAAYQQSAAARLLEPMHADVAAVSDAKG